MHALFFLANDLFVLFWVLKTFKGTCFVYFFLLWIYALSLYALYIFMFKPPFNLWQKIFQSPFLRSSHFGLRSDFLSLAWFGSSLELGENKQCFVFFFLLRIWGCVCFYRELLTLSSSDVDFDLHKGVYRWGRGSLWNLDSMTMIGFLSFGLMP